MNSAESPHRNYATKEYNYVYCPMGDQTNHTYSLVQKVSGTHKTRLGTAILHMDDIAGH